MDQKPLRLNTVSTPILASQHLPLKADSCLNLKTQTLSLHSPHRPCAVLGTLEHMRHWAVLLLTIVQDEEVHFVSGDRAARVIIHLLDCSDDPAEALPLANDAPLHQCLAGRLRKGERLVGRRLLTTHRS